MTKMIDEHLYFKYMLDEHGIHELHHYRSARQSVDASVVALDEIFSEREAGMPLLLLSHNSDAGDQPMTYALTQYRKLLRKHGSEALHDTYLAIVHENNAIIAFWTTLFNMFRGGIEVRSFGEDEAAARAWLRAMAEQDAHA